MYEVGQMIRVIEDNPDGNLSIHIGDTGIIKWVCDEDSDYDVAVEFDQEIPNGWDCEGKCEDGYGWKLRYGEFEVYEDDEDIDFSESDVNEFLSF